MSKYTKDFETYEVDKPVLPPTLQKEGDQIYNLVKNDKQNELNSEKCRTESLLEADGTDSDNQSMLTQEELTSQISNIAALSIDRKSMIEKCITHYDKMDDHITRLPQFNKKDEFLKCLSQFTSEHETLKQLKKFKNRFNADSPSLSYEIIVENQRGATLFGSKYYSKESVLYPVDPPKYQTLTGKNLEDLSMYPEPSFNWRWCWSQWHVMMINDVDEEGWIYSRIRFGSYHWSGVGKFGNFARRRIWIRMAERENNDMLDIPYISPTDSPDDSSSGDEDTQEVMENIEEDGIDTTDLNEIEGVIHVMPNFKNKTHRRQRLVKGLNKRMKRGLNTNPRIKLHHHIHKNNNIEPPILSYTGENNLKTERNNKKEHHKMVYEVESDLLNVHDIHVMHSNIEKEVPWSEEDLMIVKKTLNDINNCFIDRVKIEKLILFLLSLKQSILQYLLFDYEHSKDKSTSYVVKFLYSIHFHDSRRVFLKHLEEELEKQLESHKGYELLKMILSIYSKIIKNSLYNSEKYL